MEYMDRYLLALYESDLGFLVLEMILNYLRYVEYHPQKNEEDSYYLVH
jgi:hypothetical protein